MSTTNLGSQGSNPYLLDATGRVRVSQATTLHRAAFLFDKDDLRWSEALSASASAVFDQDKASVLLQIPAASGSSAIRQTKEYFQYVPAKGQLIDLSFKAWPQEVGLTQRVGYFDNDNGLFLQLTDDLEPAIVRREKTTGSVQNEAVLQSSWNLDKLDGTGPSGLVLDLTRVQLLVIDFQWLGVGIIRVGFALPDQTATPRVVYAHQFFGANQLVDVTLSTPKLPIRYEIRSTAPLSGPATLQQICSSVASEGGVSDRRSYSVDRAISGQPVTNALEPLISIRPNPANVRATLRAKSVRIMSSTGANFHWRLLLNPTIPGTPPSWTSVPNTNAQVDIDRDGTIPTSGPGSGFVLASGYGTADTDLTVEDILESLPAAADIAGNPDELVLAAMNTGGGNETMFGAIQVVES